MDIVTWVQNLDEAVYISDSPNNFGEDRKTIILFPARINSREDWLFNLGMATSLEEGKLNLNLLNSS